MATWNGDSPNNASGTMFSKIEAQFPNLDENADEKIVTKEFLLASAASVVIAELFGTVFLPIIYDMNESIERLNTKYLENTDKYKFIEDMIFEHKTSGQLVVVNDLKWLRRALHFISCFFKLVIDDNDNKKNTQDLSDFVITAYKNSLERYQSWFGLQLYTIATSHERLTRKEFFLILGLDEPNKEEKVLNDMREFTKRMECCIEKLTKFYAENELETA